jgi:plasmid maintenance system antidote protein VapI
MPVAEKVLPTTLKNHNVDKFIIAQDRHGHQLQLFGCLTKAMVEALNRDYTITTQDDSFTDVTKSSWYKESQKRLRHGGLIRILRTNADMSQNDLGKALNVTCKYVSDLEQGRRPVSIKMAKKLGEVFKRNPERFLPLDNQRP